MFDALVSSWENTDFHGCAFINTAAEALPGSALHARTIEHKVAVLDWVRDLAQRGGPSDPEGLARSLTLLLDGGLTAGVLGKDVSAARSAKTAAQALVDFSIPDGASSTLSLN